MSLNHKHLSVSLSLLSLSHLQMLLPLLHTHSSSLPPKTLTNQSHPPFSFFFFPSPFPKTLISPKPKPPKFLIRSSTTETLPKSAIQRIADKLRSLGYAEDNPTEPETRHGHGHGSAGEIFVPLPNQLPKYRVGHTIDPSWSTPENPVPRPGSGSAIARYHDLRNVVEEEKRMARNMEKEESVPTLAELSLKEEELRRLRTIGLKLTKKMKVGKAGITEGIVNGIHERWRRVEVVKIACEDLSKMNMKRTHDLLERKTGGLVVWRSGSNIILYRGDSYKYPYFLAGDGSTNDTSHDASADSHVNYERHGSQESYSSSMDNVNSAGTTASNNLAQSSFIKGVGYPNRVRFQLPGEAQLSEEADHLLDGLGPRFIDWWGYEPLPVDADLLPAVVPGYRRPFRLLPYGVDPTLTNDEMTILRRLGRPLPCHFALGRNRNLQGLAASIVKLWEKCEIAKVAIKRGVQNTNSELMAEELKRLTGGNLLSRDNEFIVFYRGKDFLPPAVSSAIEERRKYGSHEKQRTAGSASVIATGGPELGTIQHSSEDILDETDNDKQNFLSEQRKLRSTETAIKRTSTNLSMVLEKKARAEKLLAEIEKAEISEQPETDKEGITEEERYMLRKVGLRMKPFLLLGRRGVFDGTVENMHLHWKYRELVKIISNQRRAEDIHGVARTLEAESGGILVAVERVNKGHAIIVYRGKNYERPAILRPKTLLNKKEAMKRSLEAQRRESLKLHILKLTRNIDDMKLQLAKDRETDSMQSVDKSNVQLVKERPRAGSTSMNSNNVMDASMDSLQFIQQDKRIDFSSRYDDDSNKAESDSSSKIVTKETGVIMNLINEHGNVGSTSSPDISMSQGQTTGSISALVNTGPQVSANEKMESSVQSTLNKLEPSFHGVMECGSNGIPVRAAPLTNRERLLLRKQALKARKRPVLAIGKSNIVTGVAKAIKAHFQKHPLAIVNVKGRAQGTSVQEVIFKLEQATGAVLVSQEPSKVILYRGWGAGVEHGQAGKKNAIETSVAREGGFQPALSPELVAAIKLECGL